MRDLPRALVRLLLLALAAALDGKGVVPTDVYQETYLDRLRHHNMMSLEGGDFGEFYLLTDRGRREALRQVAQWSSERTLH